MRAARLECHVKGGAARKVGAMEVVDGLDLRVRFAGATMPAFADDQPIFDNHRSHRGIWRRPADAPFSFTEGEAHKLFVDSAAHVSGF